MRVLNVCDQVSIKTFLLTFVGTISAELVCDKEGVTITEFIHFGNGLMEKAGYLMFGSGDWKLSLLINTYG